MKIIFIFKNYKSNELNNKVHIKMFSRQIYIDIYLHGQFTL